jgi:hypothetical protein
MKANRHPAPTDGAYDCPGSLPKISSRGSPRNCQPEAECFSIICMPCPDFPATSDIAVRERESAASVNRMFRRFIKRLNVASVPSAHRDKTRLGQYTLVGRRPAVPVCFHLADGLGQLRRMQFEALATPFRPERPEQRFLAD